MALNFCSILFFLIAYWSDDRFKLNKLPVQRDKPVPSLLTLDIVMLGQGSLRMSPDEMML